MRDSRSTMRERPAMPWIKGRERNQPLQPLSPVLRLPADNAAGRLEKARRADSCPADSRFSLHAQLTPRPSSFLEFPVARRKSVSSPKQPGRGLVPTCPMKNELSLTSGRRRGRTRHYNRLPVPG